MTATQIDQPRTYTQGMTQQQKDRLDGSKDAQRVLAGKLPHRDRNATVSAAYVEGWNEAAGEAIAVLG